MQETANLPITSPVAPKDTSWKLGPREFVLKYLRYLPWIVICASLALVAAFVKIRWTNPIFKASSSMLISSEHAGGSQSDRFDALFMNQGSDNLNNEIDILRSKPVM